MTPAPSSLTQRFAAVCASIALLLGGCGGGGSSDDATKQATAFDYSEPTPALQASIATAIKSRDLSARGVSIVFEDNSEAQFSLRVVQHTVNGVQHYGAITVPKGLGSFKAPVVADIDGLEDDNPPMDLSRKLRAVGSQAGAAIFVLPGLRGRTLQYAGQSWKSGGDPCDAFDGAADDAMALLNVLQATEPLADFSKVLVRGGSRGGGVALLLGERDPRVKVVFAGSAPVDFYRADVAAAYGKMYQCQFFTGKTADQSRQAMISASALRFPTLRSVTKVYLDHGENDPTVPVLNATEMKKRLVADGIDVDLMIHAGAGHDLAAVAAYRDRRDAVFNAMFKP